MGSVSEAVCRSCGARFSVSEGGGFRFHLLKCDRCGSDRAVKFDDVEKRIPPDQDSWDDRYRPLFEQIAGSCECGGSYKLDAPARCPKCRSTDLKMGAMPKLDYD